MELHHVAWLAAHPERSQQWLEERMRDGFDVHHLNGNHDDNDPLNIVLIECGDHMMLHNGAKRFSRVVGRRGGRPREVKVAAPPPPPPPRPHKPSRRRFAGLILMEAGMRRHEETLRGCVAEIDRGLCG